MTRTHTSGPGRTPLRAALLAVTAIFSIAAAAPADVAGPAGTLYEPSDLLVQFRGALARSQMDRAARDEDAKIAEVITPDGLVKVHLSGAADVLTAMDRWSARPDVEYAVPNFRAHAFWVPNDSLIAMYDWTWNLTNVQAFDAWDVARGDPSIVLGIVDSGCAYENHPVPPYEQPFLWPGTTMYKQSPELPGPFLAGYDFVHDDDHPDDDYGHGTQVATLAAGQANNIAGSAGLAFGVTILPVKVLDYRGDAETDDIVQGIRFAADHGANVINLSLGYPPVSFFKGLLGFTQKDIMEYFRPLRDAVNYARARGAIIVAAAGNFGVPEISYPAGLPGVIAVGASDPVNAVTSYSSYGQGLAFLAPGGDFGDLNNDHIQDQLFNLSIKPFRSDGSLAKPDSFGVFPFVGTSAACGVASGAVALLLSAGVPANTAGQVLSTTGLRAFTDPSGRDLVYGGGVIQVYSALTSGRAGLGGSKTASAPASRGSGIQSRLLSRNPSQGEAVLSFRTTRPGPITARVFDVRGALVRTLIQGTYAAGEQVVRWDGRRSSGERVQGGIYFLRIESAEGNAVRKFAYLP
jgi:hypothetical protein